ncbi:Ig-like domain-containing protein [Vibrio agarivorans]|uniref:Ig-like domain-containing protein n=1 Tax=Vibrio agarivorans TaxID=153622 RepID=UPI0025B48DD3|nr:Ig-like domain-containing protein [Vibrio agarivorans]MDN3663486.1 Ig-like domain-containing protein [Vibrio agarivorans]
MRKLSKLSKALLIAGFSMSPLAIAVADSVEIGVEASESQWWSTYKVEFTNSDSGSIELRDAFVEFVLPSKTNSVQWSGVGLSYANTILTHETTSEGVLHRVEFGFDEGNWVNSELLSGNSFALTFGYDGQVDNLEAFEQSIKFNGEGGETPAPTPGIELSIIAPSNGQTLTANEATMIETSIKGEAATKVEFWVSNSKLGTHQVHEEETHYSQSWTPNELGDTTITVIVFDEDNKQLEQQSVSVLVEPEQDFEAPEVRFITPGEGDVFKKTETISISVDASDVDGDLATVVVKANNVMVCEFDDEDVAPFNCDWQSTQAGSVTLDAVATDEQNLSATASVQITVTETSNSCGDVAQYQDGINYQLGDRVSNIGEVFSCTQPGWCGDPVWTPGTGHPNYPEAWKDAWQTEGVCDPNELPEVDLISPANGDRLSPNQAFEVIVEASDADGEIVKVEALLNGDVVKTVTEPTEGNTYKLEIPAQVEGAYELVTVAYDDKNASSATKPITLAVTDKDLAIGLTSPVDGSSFTQGRSIKLTAEAHSFVGEMKSVTFMVNDEALATVDEAPFEYDWIGAQIGTHEIIAAGTNTEGDTQQTPVSTIKVTEPKEDLDLRNNPDRNVTYLTSWGITDIEDLHNSQGDAYFLSFGGWDANGNAFVTDSMIEPHYEPSWMAPGYQSWTTLKHKHPNKTIMIAFGGATHESIWSHMGTDAQREAIADSLIDMMNTPYPVYLKNLKPEEMVGECLETDYQGNCDYTKYQLAGYVSIDGVDFDYETTPRLTEQDNRNLEALIEKIRAKIGMSKIISLTTYHVGADPVECENPAVFENCSFIEDDRSAHHGEVISLLQNTKDTVDFFNVMAYDAGENFLYDVAMANYAEHVGDPTKVVLGATINSQWKPGGSFVETRENNIERARWQKEQGYGGFFIWTLGSNNQGLSMQEQVEYFNEMISYN